MRIDLRPIVLSLTVLLSSAVILGAYPTQRRNTETRLTELEAQVAALQEAQQTALGQLGQMRLDLDNTLEPMRVRLADFGEDMRGIESRLVALEEQLAITNEALAHISEQLAMGGGVGTGAQPATTAGTPMPLPQRPAGVPAPAVANQPQATEQQSESSTLYSAAYTDYLAADYSLAISGFQEFLRLYPDSEQADNAQYWIGESYYSQEDYRAARSAFREIPRRYPNAETLPDALFKSAQCLVELGAIDEGVEEFMRLIGSHPLSGATRIACLQLERLGVVKPPQCPQY
jgi:tol-pal system protein YbgF